MSDFKVFITVLESLLNALDAFNALKVLQEESDEKKTNSDIKNAMLVLDKANQAVSVYQIDKIRNMLSLLQCTHNIETNIHECKYDISELYSELNKLNTMYGNTLDIDTAIEKESELKHTIELYELTLYGHMTHLAYVSNQLIQSLPIQCTFDDLTRLLNVITYDKMKQLADHFC